MMKSEPSSPQLDASVWPHPKPYDDDRKLITRRLSHSGSRSPARAKFQNPYDPNNSRVRRPSDASETSTLVGSSSGSTGGSVSLLIRMGNTAAEDSSPSLLRRLPTPKWPSDSTSPKRKAGQSPSGKTFALSEAHGFADRLIQEALSEGKGGESTLMGEDGGERSRVTVVSYAATSDNNSHTTPHDNVFAMNVDNEGFSPASESAVDEMLLQSNGTDNNTASPSPILNENSPRVPSADQPYTVFPPPSDSQSLEEVRHALLPIILKNVLRRNPDADLDATKRNAANLLTDEQCLEFLRLAKETKKQLAAKEERERSCGQRQQHLAVAHKETDAASESAHSQVSSDSSVMSHRAQDNGWPRNRKSDTSQIRGGSHSRSLSRGKEKERTQDCGWPRRHRLDPADGTTSSHAIEKTFDKGKEAKDIPSVTTKSRSYEGRAHGRHWDRDRRFSEEDEGEEHSNVNRRPAGESLTRKDDCRRSSWETPRRDETRDRWVKREIISPTSPPHCSPSADHADHHSRRDDLSPFQKGQKISVRRSRSPHRRDARASFSGQQADRRRPSRPRLPLSPNHRGRPMKEDVPDIGHLKDLLDETRRSSIPSALKSDPADVGDKPCESSSGTGPVKTDQEHVSPTKKLTPRMPKAMLSSSLLHSVNETASSKPSSASVASKAAVEPNIRMATDRSNSTEVATAKLEQGELINAPVSFGHVVSGHEMPKSSGVHLESVVVLQQSATNTPTVPLLATPGTVSAASGVGLGASSDHPPREKSSSSGPLGPVIPAAATLDVTMRVDESTIDHQTAVPKSANSRVQATSPKTEGQRQPTEGLSTPHAVPEFHASSPTLVPGLWSVVVGGPSAGIANMNFFVDDEVAAAVRRWSQREVDLDGSASHVATYILCLPAEQVAEVNANLDPKAPPDVVVSALWDVETEWPPPGSLIVDINNGDSAPHHHSWIPVDLVAPLDVSSYIKPGWNTARLIQLADISKYVFVLHASLPPQEEVARFAQQNAKKTEFKSYIQRRWPGSIP